MNRIVPLNPGRDQTLEQVIFEAVRAGRARGRAAAVCPVCRGAMRHGTTGAGVPELSCVDCLSAIVDEEAGAMQLRLVS
jgi:hypothetical protein